MWDENEKAVTNQDFVSLLIIVKCILYISLSLFLTCCNPFQKPSCFSHYLSDGKDFKDEGKYAEAITSYQAACACPNAKTFEIDILVTEAKAELDKIGVKENIIVDSDNDGVANDVDDCDSLPGVNNGCPVVMYQVLDSFSDKDGRRYSYSGSTYFHKPDGYGVAKYSDKKIYYGDFVKGLKNGKGRLVWDENISYTGNFKDDKFQGSGVWKSSNGIKYEGNFKGGKFVGKGMYLSKNGNEYRGEFGDGLFEGKGILIYAKGSKYVGDFVNGMFEGEGTFTACDTCKIYNCTGTSVFSGHWKADKKHGAGKCYKKIGGKLILIHEGDFIDGKPVGIYPNKI